MCSVTATSSRQRRDRSDDVTQCVMSVLSFHSKQVSSVNSVSSWFTSSWTYHLITVPVFSVHTNHLSLSQSTRTGLTVLFALIGVFVLVSSFSRHKSWLARLEAGHNVGFSVHIKLYCIAQIDRHMSTSYISVETDGCVTVDEIGFKCPVISVHSLCCMLCQRWYENSSPDDDTQPGR